MIAFVVNGDEQSAMAMRAQAFARHLARRWPIEVGYRRKGRVGSIPQLAWWLARQRPDAIWVFDMALSGVVASTLVKPGGARLIIDTGDVIAELARQSRLRGRMGVLATSGLERLAEAAADALIVRGTAHAELYAERGIQTTLIPDGVEVDQFASVGRREATRHSLGVTDELVVGLVGSTVWSPSLGLTYGWDLVEALGQLRDLPVVGLIVGDGSGIPHLRERARALDVNHRLRFAGRQPYDTLPDWLSACDVCLSTQTNDLVGQVRTTGKLPLYMASGRYVLASRVGEARRVLPEQMLIDYDGTVDRAYPARLAFRIRTLCEQRDQLDLGTALVDVARREFDYSVLAERADALLRRVVAARTGLAQDGGLVS